MYDFEKTQMDIFTQAVRDAVRFSRNMLMRPAPDYKSALLAIDEARDVLSAMRGIVGFYAYNDPESRAQGPCDACPSAPVEDDPA